MKAVFEQGPALQASEAAVYLTSLIGRPVSTEYARVLAHRDRWRRWNREGRTWYLLDDIDTTADRMSAP